DLLAQSMLLVDKLQRAYQLPGRWRRHVWHWQMQHCEGMFRQGVGGQWRFRHREDRTDPLLFQPGQLLIEPLTLLRQSFFFALAWVPSLPAPRTRAARQQTIDHPIKTAHSLSCTSSVVCVHRCWHGSTSTYASCSQV